MTDQVIRTVVNGLQIPANGLSIAEARAKAVSQINGEPVSNTPESTENGEESVKTQPIQGA
jgi:hypothetical protein